MLRIAPIGIPGKALSFEQRLSPERLRRHIVWLQAVTHAWIVIECGVSLVVTTKENAAKTDSREIIRVFDIRFTRRSAIHQKGEAAPKRHAQVEGLR